MVDMDSMCWRAGFHIVSKLNNCHFERMNEYFFYIWRDFTLECLYWFTVWCAALHYLEANPSICLPLAKNIWRVIFLNTMKKISPWYEKQNLKIGEEFMGMWERIGYKEISGWMELGLIGSLRELNIKLMGWMELYVTRNMRNIIAFAKMLRVNIWIMSRW